MPRGENGLYCERCCPVLQSDEVSGMTKRFMINRHPHVITATEIQIKGSTGIFEPVLRFPTLDDLMRHFAELGVPAAALEAVREGVNSTRMVSLVFFEENTPRD
jgi:hypothetical protein